MIKFRKILPFVLIGIIFVLLGIFIYFSNKNKIVQVIPQPIPVSTSSAIFAKVTRVIDGDTIVIDTGEHIRYIGMNTPELETNDCFATEASEINKNLVLGKTVKLEKDISDTDKYGRLLRYVYVDNIFVDDYLVKNGSARVETVKPDVKYESEFVTSEKFAKVNHLGLWGKCL
jgi:micrococcal nuclease